MNSSIFIVLITTATSIRPFSDFFTTIDRAETVIGSMAEYQAAKTGQTYIVLKPDSPALSGDDNYDTIYEIIELNDNIQVNQAANYID